MVDTTKRIALQLEPLDALDFLDRLTERTPAIELRDRLVCVVGQDAGRTFGLAGSTLEIGRGSDVEVRLLAHDVSRRHARITRTTSGTTIEDLASVNGTYVNGVLVKSRRRIEIGDRIQIGNTILVYTRHDELEQRLQKLQRLEAMSDLARGIAHDFNNMLTVIVSGLDELSQSTDPELRRNVEAMTQAASSATQLAKRLMRVGRNNPTTGGRVEVGKVVREAAAIAQTLLPRSVWLETDVPATIRIHADAPELIQALINLILNARDAMPDGGCIRIAASEVTIDGDRALHHQLVSGSTYVEVLVSDSGVGMDDLIRARIFEPFFTTKPPGKGAGLGLAMVFSTVRNHVGAIEVDSAPGEGTTVRLLLPVAL
jgi:signal transduction histidine kinase